jgi:hypothetical protein
MTGESVLVLHVLVRLHQPSLASVPVLPRVAERVGLAQLIH